MIRLLNIRANFFAEAEIAATKITSLDASAFARFLLRHVHSFNTDAYCDPSEGIDLARFARLHLDRQIPAPRPPDRRVFYFFTLRSFLTALKLAKLTRESDRSQWPTASVFAQQYARLELWLKYCRRPPDWPATPGTKYSWHGGSSGADVANQFADTIHGGAVYGRTRSSFSLGPAWIEGEGLAAHDWDLVDLESDPRVVTWRDTTIENMRTSLVPPPEDWPMWMIHRDSDALLAVLHDENDRAQRRSQSRSRPRRLPIRLASMLLSGGWPRRRRSLGCSVARRRQAR